jgi:hypothetical protein
MAGTGCMESLRVARNAATTAVLDEGAVSLYICEDHEPAKADNMQRAGEIFAARKTKIEYGKYKKAETRLVSLSKDGLTAKFEAFIGPKKTGHNVQFSVYRVTYGEA